MYLDDLLMAYAHHDQQELEQKLQTAVNKVNKKGRAKQIQILYGQNEGNAVLEEQCASVFNAA